MDNSELIGISDNGLEIHWLENDDGRCCVELRVPAEGDSEHTTFATLVRDENGAWRTRRSDTRSPDVLWVIRRMDGEYDVQRRKQEQDEIRRQEERAEMRKSFDGERHNIIVHFGGREP